MLSRYRMLDLSRLLPGPFASHVLADMGMDVIKVEEPEPRYGMGRDVLTPPEPTPEEEVRAAAHNSLARNKRSIALNLLAPELRPTSQEVFYRLARDADVVLEGYRPGVVEWMGVDYARLREHNPRIIYCSISGYGQSGPYSKLPGHDQQYLSVAGLVGEPDEDGRPSGPGIPIADLTSGLYAANAILAALLEREESGEGQYIDVPMVGAAMSLGVLQSSPVSPFGRAAGERRGPGLSLLRCKDGRYLSTANAETLFWENFCRAIGHEEYIPLRHGSGPEYDRMVDSVRELFLTRTRDEWLDVLWRAETCAAPVNTFEEALTDPQVRHIGMAWDVEHPTVGALTQPGFPVAFSRTTRQFERFAPVLGEHTRELLAEAGYSDAERQQLERDGIVRSTDPVTKESPSGDR